MKSFNPKYLTPGFLHKDTDKNTLFDDKGNNIFHGEVLSYDFCDFVMGKVKEYELKEKNNPSATVNSMHKNGISAAQLGISDYINSFINLFLLKTLNPEL